MEEPRGNAPPAPSPGARRLDRRVLIAAVPLALLVVVFVAYRLLLGAFVRHRAAGLGVELDFDSVSWGDGGLDLRHARATLDGVRGVTVDADVVRVATRGLEVTSVAAEGVAVSVEGSATDRVLELAAWSGEHADAYRLAGTGSDVRVAWRAGEGATPWLTTSGGSLTSDGKGARFQSTAASVGGVSVGQVGASWTADATGVSLEIGKGTAGEAPITARVSTTPKPPRVEVTLRPVKLESLGASLGLALPAPGATASGQLALVLGKRGSAEAIDGNVQLTLDGWTPPHPREVSGIIGGKKTTFASKFSLAADRSKVTLTDVVVRAGRLTLKGAGAITRAGDHATARLEIAGPIACAELARNVAREDLGVLGGLAGDLAGSAVEGSVSVNVTVDADSRDLRAAKVTPRIGVGCGLKLPGR
jgi:predicted thioesterase